MTAPSSAPRYGTACVDTLLPDALTALRGDQPLMLPLPQGLSGVIVLVVDGLGRSHLDGHAATAPFLAAASGPTLDAPFPTSTATSLTTIGTGRPPGEHGLVGYSMAVRDDDRPLILLTWSWDRQDLGLDARDTVVPEVFQPHPTLFERAADEAVTAVTVLRPEFATSGLTRAGLRGGRIVTAVGLEGTVVAALEAAARPGPTLVYAHHGDLDTIGHLNGPGSDPSCTELAAIDDVLEVAAQRLPPDVVLVVTGDHGMVAASDHGFVELADRPELLDGVRVLTGDGRARQLHVVDGAADDVTTLWRESCGDLADVRTRDEAIAAGWFGPVVANDVRSRIGDVIVCARALDVSWVHRDRDLFGGRLRGQHGALTRHEVEVPALVLTSR